MAANTTLNTTSNPLNVSAKKDEQHEVDFDNLSDDEDDMFKSENTPMKVIEKVQTTQPVEPVAPVEQIPEPTPIIASENSNSKDEASDDDLFDD